MTMNPEPPRLPEELEELLAGPEPDWEAEPVPPAPENVDAMLYRLRRVRQEAARETVAAQQRIAQIQVWLEERLAVYDHQEKWLRAALQRYHAAVLSLRPTAKTIQLPSGTLVSRMGQPQWELEEEKVLDWALPAPVRARLQAVFIRLEADLAEILGDTEWPTREAVRVDGKLSLALSKTGLKNLLTRRDAKNKAIAWGVTDGGEKPPGVTVTEPERTYDVRLPGDADEEEEQA